MKDVLKQYDYDIVIIGGGPAGLSAAISAKKNGIKNILLVEREKHLGGILNQCIHDGFGLHYFKESMTGPEYAERLINELNGLNINYITDAMVINITPNKEIEYVHKTEYAYIKAKAIILTMGCRERTRYNITIPGTRPAGIYTAGTAQSLINLQNLKIGNNIVILGSGDIGLIMARRLSLEGMNVIGVYEILPYPAGLIRNIQQCLNDYDIPLYLSKTITRIFGVGRIKSVEISDVDKHFNILKGTQKIINCDTLLLSVGLIPENELTKKANISINPITGGAYVDSTYQTNIEGIFSAGNVLHIHDLADWASIEAEKSAYFASLYLKSLNINKQFNTKNKLKILFDVNFRYVIPNFINPLISKLKLSFRVKKPIKSPKIIVRDKNNNILIRKRYIKLIPSELVQINIKHHFNSDIYVGLE